ncbi:hypothetical protein GCM10009678_04810 [Actinomadura kijaniata]|uniref:DUF927 domain-containing protein n=1 Tax=Actinomadura namibiensis TaxID=182080 RepID=A0A7W3QNT8_ACTNM|nr:DUF927 domain-containing protein [Actinomadura namibiensis]MBA8953954.1 hypothetical protein [Actinomadura namibiensis]
MSTRDHNDDDRPHDPITDGLSSPSSVPPAPDLDVADQPADKRPPTKRDRALALLRQHLQLRRSEHGGWPYARDADTSSDTGSGNGGRLFRFNAAGRRDLCAEARYLWRKAHPDQEPPDDRTLRSVVADLERAAQDAPLDDAAATEWLRQHGVTFTAPIAEDRGLASVLELPGCPLPDGYRVPDPYTISPDGIWIEPRNRDPERITWAPLAVTQVFTDPEGEQMVKLVWLNRGRWQWRIIPRGKAKSGRMLVKELGDFGLPVTEADAKAAERWLAAVETANTDVIDEVTIARSLGWQADGQFVVASGTPYEIHGVEPQLQRALEAHHARGTLSEWQDAIKILGRYPLAAMALYAGLAAPLLEILGVGSFTLNLGGRSTSGKTTAAQAGLSCWANPDEAGGAITSWASTRTAYQARLALAGNGVPVLFDDTQTAERPEHVSQALYQITQNQGKGRMGEWKSYRWRTIVLSTGERSALSFATHQGISARVLDLQGAPFGNTPSSGHDAQTFREGVTANYGHAGPAFVGYLRAYVGEHGPAWLRDRHATLTGIHRQGASDLARRRAPLVAVVRLAAELAHTWNLVPFPSPDDHVWTSLFAANDPRDNRAALALEVIAEYIATNAERLYQPDRHAPAAGWIGVRTQEEGDPNAVALMPEKVREALDRAGYELDAVLPTWREMDALHEHPPTSKQTPRYKLKRRIAGEQVKCLVFTGQALGANDTGS